MASLTVAKIVLKLSFVVFPVGKQYLYLAVRNSPAIKAALYNFIWVTIQDSYALRFAFTPFPFKNCSVCELTDAYAMPLIILEVSLVFLAIRVYYLAHSMF